MEKSVDVIGRCPVYEYLQAGLTSKKSFITLLDSAKGESIDTITTLAKKRGIRITKSDKRFFQKLEIHDNNTQGVVLTSCSPYPELSDSQIEKSCDEKRPLLILDQVTDPQNLGAIIRSAEALGIGGILLPKDNTSGITSTVIKTSAGATAHMPVQYVTNLARKLDELKDLGFWIAGSSDHGDTPPAKLREFAPLALVIGNEGKGMRKLTEKKCDIICRIELKGKINSLNASVAAGILMYEAMNIN